MALTKTLLELRNAVVSGAAIDGQAVVGGRHPPSDLNERINRYIFAVRSFARSEGGELFEQLSDIATLPAATANEDFIEVDWPTTAEEVTGVDVLTSGSPKWQPLDGADWSQRRSLNSERGYPSGGVGWWAVKSMPEARASASVTAGKIALFPSDLAGSYRIGFVEQWTPMTGDTHVWAYHADWDTWVISSVVMELTQRDTNKKGLFALAERNFLRAEARIKAAAGRVGPGYSVPTRVGGEWV
jgi:hypothetical protein